MRCAPLMRQARPQLRGTEVDPVHGEPNPQCDSRLLCIVLSSLACLACLAFRTAGTRFAFAPAEATELISIPERSITTWVVWDAAIRIAKDSPTTDTATNAALERLLPGLKLTVDASGGGWFGAYAVR